VSDAGPAPAAGGIPEIRTERLVLRAFAGADYQPFLAMMAEPNVFEHIGGKPLDDEEGMRRLCMYAGLFPIQGAGMWAVEDQASGRLVGQVGLFNLNRKLDPHPPGRFEMGWIFATESHGRGLAREACQAALGWLSQAFGPTDLFAIIAPGNAPSMKLAERLGFERTADASYKDETISCWQRAA
jgi:RimJ/RimL family protein N-acetyltransferase